MSKLILTNEVTGLGAPGDVVDVKNGYARNYLIPQGFAVAWSRGAQKQIEQIKAARSAREHATLEDAQAFKAALEAATVKVSAKAGNEGRLFGSVTASDIAAAVAESGLGSIDKRKIELGAPIKAIGSHEATVRLREDLVAVITLQVIAAK